MKKLFLLAILVILSVYCVSAQDKGDGQSRSVQSHVLKRYNIFFESGASTIDYSYCGNADILLSMKKDIESTMMTGDAFPDSLLITSSSSPDGYAGLNRRLAEKRATETQRILLQMFPQLENATIIINHHEASWEGLEQIIRANGEFPQAAEVLSIINSDMTESAKEAALRGCTKGWNHIVANYLYALRTSSITVRVAFDGKMDEYVQEIFTEEEVPETKPAVSDDVKEETTEVQVPVGNKKKMIMAARTNLLTPAMSIGLEFPIKDNWSIGFDYYYPWVLPKSNKWCVQTLAVFGELRYWFPGQSYKWSDDQRLQGHSIGLYGGVGYYDYQLKEDGLQGEFVDVGVDYTFALPIAKGKLRMEFNIGIGVVRSWYRPYYMSSDYSDLIKEPGILYNTTNFIGPTKAGVSFVVPIRVQTKASKAERKGGKQ